MPSAASIRQSLLITQQKIEHPGHLAEQVRFPRCYRSSCGLFQVIVTVDASERKCIR